MGKGAGKPPVRQTYSASLPTLITSVIYQEIEHSRERHFTTITKNQYHIN